MSRSKRYTSKDYRAGSNAGTMKEFKRICNKSFRSQTREALRNEVNGIDKDSVYPYTIREGGDLWSSPPDGNQVWFGDMKETDKESYDRKMRK